MDGSKNRKKIIEKEIWTDKIKGKPLINVTTIWDMKLYVEAWRCLPCLKFRV